MPAPSDLTINGSGSSFVYPILSQWIYTWDQDTASDINYNPVGSVLGEQALAQGTVTFAASEIPLPKESLQKREQAQFPIVLGGVVICVNLPNMKASDFVIDGKTLVAIYEGKITRWDDPAIKALNPDLDLPGRKITPVFRTDGSGTTWAFAQYLTKNDPEWGKKFPTSAIIDWPVGIGARGNVELAAYISTIPYSLGYVEYAYAIENRLKISSMRNADGKIVQPDLETFTSTLDSIDWDNVTNFDIDLVDRPGANAWPITAMSFIIMSQAPKDEDAAKEILRFFDWCYNNGSSIAKDLYFVPLPDEAVNRIHAYWSINIQANGKPVYR
ncbi:MAG: phosphate ABC transporter substrate-binding protein PstS [Puniceicoccales bacterium]